MDRAAWTTAGAAIPRLVPPPAPAAWKAPESPVALASPQAALTSSVGTAGPAPGNASIPGGGVAQCRPPAPGVSS